MAVKRRCIGCGAYYDYSFGKTHICPYCGTEQNPGLSKDALKYMENAENFRRNCDFTKSINEYNEALKINDSLAEAQFGIFLATYKINSVDDLHLNYEINNRESVFTNNEFISAIKNGGSNSKKWYQLGEKIEHQRVIINDLSKAIHNNKYLAMLFVDENSVRDKEIADHVFSQLQEKVNLLYPPYSFSKLSDEHKNLAINIAISEIPLLFIIQSSNTKNEEVIKSISEEFLSYWDGCYLYFISDDFYNIFSEIERSNIELDYEADDLFENILDEIAVMANLPLSVKIKLKKDRKLEKDCHFSPIISLKEN